MKLIYLVRLSLLVTFVVVMLGAYTRLADAGLGCPDWPGCYGHFTVPNETHEIALAQSLFPSLVIEEDKAWLEMIHRYVAGGLGLIVFAITFVGLKTRQLSLMLSVAVTTVVVFQALLGMWTVTMKLMPIVVMGHLLGGFTLFSLLALCHWQLQRKAPVKPSINKPSRLRYWAVATLLVVVAQIALGGWTSSNYAALMCTSLPICEGNWSAYLDFATAFDLIQPPQESYEFGTLDYAARMTIHVTHRLGAVVVSAMVIVLAYRLFITQQASLRKTALALVTMLMVQIGLGIGNVLLSLPLVIAVAHNLGAALLLLTVLRANYVLWAVRELSLVASNSLSKESIHE
ncbi:heme A synthase [Vibrio sp. JPW-9-11-11]|uniref:COX15/CtaA family protein n=1 Tax=Vibrio sp. JPW-9-11-11 TaxID=1416532 RepID=UPI0015949FFC|nr:COX15/CtaA family protein [Vibrio sp. JPW-9-11-11]NVD08512.1 heme A synthase [Vibrio sp. JPW-9-11-11]